MEKIQAAVIGSGYLGKFHAEKYAHHPEVELRGVVDTNFSRAQELASEVHSTPFRNYQDLFAQVQAVSVVVPTPLHYSIAKEFLEHEQVLFGRLLPSFPILLFSHYYFR